MANIDDEKITNERRNFLKMVGLGTVAGGTAIATSQSAQADTLEETDNGSGYRETSHVKTYYDLARF